MPNRKGSLSLFVLALGVLFLGVGGAIPARAAAVAARPPAFAPPGPALLRPGAARPTTPATGCDPVWALETNIDGYPANGGFVDGVAAVTATDVWAVGGYYPGNDAEFGLILHWDGRQWRMVDSPKDAWYFLIGVSAVSANDVWAVGRTDPSPGRPVIVHWDGMSWHWIPDVPVPSGGTSTVGSAEFYRVAARAANDVWAVGGYSTGTDWAPLIEHWDGLRWTVAYSAPPNPGPQWLYDVTAVAADDAWAVGDQVLHWDGQQWSVSPVPYPGSFNGVTARARNDVWAVGEGSNGTLIVHWDGLSWTQVPSPNVPGFSNELWNVRFTGANDGWATGVYHGNDPGNDPAGTLMLHWDGAQWTLSPSPDLPHATDVRLYGVAAVAPGEAWTTGWTANGPPGMLLEHYASPCPIVPGGPAAAPAGKR